MANLHPLPGYALVRLGSKYKNITAPSKSYDGATNGILVEYFAAGLGGIDKEDYLEALGRQVFWEEQVTGTRVTVDGETYVMPRVTELRGYEEVGEDA